jgi:hypothetical protein
MLPAEPSRQKAAENICTSITVKVWTESIAFKLSTPLKFSLQAVGIYRTCNTVSSKSFTRLNEIVQLRNYFILLLKWICEGVDTRSDHLLEQSVWEVSWLWYKLILWICPCFYLSFDIFTDCRIDQMFDTGACSLKNDPARLFDWFTRVSAS